MVTTSFIVTVDDNSRHLEPATPWTATVRAHDGTLRAVGFGTSQTDAVHQALHDPLGSWPTKPTAPTVPSAPAAPAHDGEPHGPTPMP